MAHFSENSHPLIIKYVSIQTNEELQAAANGLTDVCIIRLPACETPDEYDRPLKGIGRLVAEIADKLGSSTTLITLGEVIDLVQIQAEMSESVRYQHWIMIKRTSTKIIDSGHLPHEHFGALVSTRYKQSLRHTKTRIRYSYCPICDKTTKDYGGKKHTYHETGTLISDVWRDIDCDLEGDISLVLKRFADLFGMESYKELVMLDCRSLNLQRSKTSLMHLEFEENKLSDALTNQVINGDCLEILKAIPSNSVDFAFADPPYNLSKKYIGYTDDLKIQDYFKWCGEWIAEMARVLKPGRTFALLNIPLWAVRHFLFMQTVLKYQNWIVWDALAYPVRLIMPAHYTILCFSKGKPRQLSGLTGESEHIRMSSAPKTFNALEPLADNYCLRSDCVEKRLVMHINDRTTLTDIWGDIHRLKHNSRRVDHPCQLPPHLMYRIISIFSKPGEVILDCFNGAGTTTLTAHQLGRKYLGIDSSEKYSAITNARHLEILNGLDPFRKEERTLTSKNSPVRRLEKQVYKIPKKTLQLEVKRVAIELGHLPSRDELIEHGKYPIEYYDTYFVSWGEVCAAARTTGMSETRVANEKDEPAVKQLRLLEKKS